MDSPAQYLQFDFILISLANLIVIVLLLLVFTLAVALRRPEKNRLSTIDFSENQNMVSGSLPAESETKA